MHYNDQNNNKYVDFTYFNMTDNKMDIDILPAIKTEQSEPQDVKPQIENKSSMEILSELFGTFNADPPVIVKKEKDDKVHRKLKKKHKKKDKKHKKHKSKKKKNKSGTDSSKSSDSEDNIAIDLSDILIKKESTDSQMELADTLTKIINIKVKPEVKTEVDDGSRESKPEKEKLDKKIELSTSKGRHSSPEGKKRHKHHKRKKESSEKEKEKEQSIKKLKTDKKERQSSRCTPEKCDNSYDGSRRSPKRRSFLDLRNKLDKHHDFNDKSGSKHNTWKDRDRFYKDSSPKYDYNRDDRRGNRRKNDHSYRDRSAEDRKRRKNSCSDHHASDEHIDKKKLLEIARKNAINMMKSGSLPAALTLGRVAQEKVIAAIKCGGKTVEELTDFCKTLSRKEELGDLSSVSEDSDSDSGRPFHHPFIVKDKPLIINIKNSVPLPVKSNKERTVELSMQFPVSSGQQHRKNENEWVPVVPAKTTVEKPSKQAAVAEIKAAAVVPVQKPAVSNDLKTSAATTTVLSPVASAVVEPGKKVTVQENVDIAAMVSQRLQAMRKLQENPNDSQAIVEIYKAQKEMNSWAESKQAVGQFTGSTGVQILSPAQLASGHQAWARKDQLQSAAPVSGGMGMHLLQKMGWKPGEGLGKDKSGSLEPLLLEVKLDKKGIVASEEGGKKKAPKVAPRIVKTSLEGKHPVSLLGEYVSKKKLGPPEYRLDFECGPDHKKNFLFKVIVAGVEYKPNVACGTKKEAKALAATVCLQSLGLLPT